MGSLKINNFVHILFLKKIILGLSPCCQPNRKYYDCAFLPESFPWLKLYWLQDLPLLGTGRLGKLFVSNWKKSKGVIPK
jgi:hypothetical protein